MHDSVQEKKLKKKKPNRFCLLPTLQLTEKVKASENDIKWQRPNSTYYHARYERIRKNYLHVMANINVFAKYDGQPRSWPAEESQLIT